MSSAERQRWLIRDVELSGRRADCRLSAGLVSEIGTDLEQQPGERLLQGNGGELIPGLADHHLHIFSAVAAANSLDLAGAAELPAHEGQGSGWLRVIGAGVALRRSDLDRTWAGRPVRVQHRSGALWTLNTAAVERLAAGLTAEERRTGQLWRTDARLRRLLAIDTGGTTDADDGDLVHFSTRLASYGVTHVTDATPDIGAGSLRALGRAVAQHLLSLSEAGSGPRKIILADHRPPDFDALVAQVSASHAEGRPVAVHCVSAVALAVTIAALDLTSTLPGDRIEHAAVCDDAAAERLADLGVTVVTQPTIFARHHRAFRQDSDPRERPLLWRYGALLRAGVAVAVSSDAPYGDADPWATVRAAVQRESDPVPASVVLDSLMADPLRPGGPPRHIRVGAPADLCLLTEPLAPTLVAAVAGAPIPVLATFVSGNRVFDPRDAGCTPRPHRPD